MMKTIAVIGGGNGGQAMAGHLAAMGHKIRLYSRNIEKLEAVIQFGGIELSGKINVFGEIDLITDKLQEAVTGAELIMIVTPANAHRVLAEQLAPHLQPGQVVVLNPGRTGGALEFRHVLNQSGMSKLIYVAEAQSLVYACRITSPAHVKIYGEKRKVLISALPTTDINYILEQLAEIYNCFVPTANVLVSSFENLGTILHPALVIFNLTNIEKRKHFLFYHDITPSAAKFLLETDKERIRIAQAYNIDVLPIQDWVSEAYSGIEGDSLYKRLYHNPAYSKIVGPKTLHTRLLYEDIPTGIVPLVEFARLAGLQTPIMSAILTIASVLQDQDYSKNGRTLERLGLAGKSIDDILRFVSES
jgi:opine dehydrogenase